MMFRWFSRRKLKLAGSADLAYQLALTIDRYDVQHDGLTLEAVKAAGEIISSMAESRIDRESPTEKR